MELVVDRLESSFKNVRVNLGRRKVGVTEQCLDNPQIGPSLQEMGSERMANHVGTEIPVAPCLPSVFLYDLPETDTTEAPPTPRVNEQIV